MRKHLLEHLDSSQKWDLLGQLDHLLNFKDPVFAFNFRKTMEDLVGDKLHLDLVVGDINQDYLKHLDAFLAVYTDQIEGLIVRDKNYPDNENMEPLITSTAAGRVKVCPGGTPPEVSMESWMHSRPRNLATWNDGGELDEYSDIFTHVNARDYDGINADMPPVWWWLILHQLPEDFEGVVWLKFLSGGKVEKQ